MDAEVLVSCMTAEAVLIDESLRVHVVTSMTWIPNLRPKFNSRGVVRMGRTSLSAIPAPRAVNTSLVGATA